MWEGIAGIDKMSLIDFPGVPSIVLFYRGCQLSCPYCHNPELSSGKTVEMDRKEVDRFMSGSVRRVQGVVFTGGEPLMWAWTLAQSIAWCHDHGLKTKLDTNGLLFDYHDPLVNGAVVDGCDYVAVDLKLPIDRYPELAGGRQVRTDNLVSLLQYLDAERDKSTYEVRTTVCPGLLKLEDLREMRKIVNPERWYLQQFRSGICLDRSLEGSQAYPDKELLAFARELGCNTRGIKEDAP